MQSPHDLYAATVGEALDVESQDSHVDVRAALAIPGWWTPTALDRVRKALELRNIEVLLVNDAQAAVIEYQHETNALPDTVVVVNLRGNQVSAVVVRACQAGAIPLASPKLVHEEGGNDLDIGVLQHLVAGLNAAGHGLDSSDPAVLSAAKDALASYRTLRESLSLSITESLTPAFPNVTQRLRLVRSELEGIATPWADSVVRTVSAVVEQSPLEVQGILLVGGLAHMPLVSQRLSADLGFEVYVPDEPTLIVVRGAERILTSKTLPVHTEPTTELEPHASPEATPHHQRASFWSLVRDRVAQWTGPIHTVDTRSGTVQAAPERAMAEQTAPHPELASEAPSEVIPPYVVETLLDEVAVNGADSSADTSWIPGSSSTEKLVKQQ